MTSVKEHFDTCKMATQCYDHPFECVGRDPMRVGDFELSIQASCQHYSTPRFHVGKEPAAFYDSVEIAAWPAASRRRWGVWSTPENCALLAQFESIWNGEDVASFVEWDDVQRVADALAATAASAEE